MATQGKLDVLILGSGGREHALLKACLRSPRVAHVRVAPGNGGMALEAECLEVDVNNSAAVLELVRQTGTNFVIVGPEVPLAAGVVDVLEDSGIPAYGPRAAGARLEASKAFTKDFLFRHKIPTAASATFDTLEPALAYVRQQPLPIVIKASGLAAGKGVVIALTHAEAEAALRAMMEAKIFGASGDEVVIEEFMQGEEASIMLMVCGEDYLMLPPSQDHKRVGEGDTGLNTGGMGAYAPTTVVTAEVERRLREEIIVPTLRGLKADGIDYRGTLYVGIMVTSIGPRVVEFNVRFGDPECQVLMPSLETDPVQIMEDIALRRFKASAVKLRPGATIIVVLAAGGYPGEIRKGDVISLPTQLPEGVDIVHGGTKRLPSGQVVTTGGRVLGVVAHGKTLAEAAERAYSVVPQIHFEGCHYRRDIGYRQLRRDGVL
ncbi:MAG: phosphoribosylamine--glycine ligase [Verrucomicrobia bacterium]|nr:phosphoribosylamine--glycine ligase [Verrucomicrobiota bacterium]NBS05147.1 phosphoribosylamine--glycine ligase [Verrucomicrobiota bacterium]NBY36625.1 phosphoribosylamine--glycine ligase [Verrucomicrobiota bacterium]